MFFNVGYFGGETNFKTILKYLLNIVRYLPEKTMIATYCALNIFRLFHCSEGSVLPLSETDDGFGYNMQSKWN